MAYQIGHKKVGGKKKGSKNKSTLFFGFAKEITLEEKQELFREVYNHAIELVRKNNVTIINTLLNKMLPNAEIVKSENNDIEIPQNIDELSETQANELYDKLTAKK
jgi:exoribonuclease R